MEMTIRRLRNLLHNPVINADVVMVMLLVPTQEQAAVSIYDRTLLSQMMSLLLVRPTTAITLLMTRSSDD
jgi:hypothetical protein